jgi:hypothetical protein
MEVTLTSGHVHTEQEVAECILEDHEANLAVNQLCIQEVVQEVRLFQTTLNERHLLFDCCQNSRVGIGEAEVDDVGQRLSNFAWILGIP